VVHTCMPPAQLIVHAALQVTWLFWQTMLTDETCKKAGLVRGMGREGGIRTCRRTGSGANSSLRATVVPTARAQGVDPTSRPVASYSSRTAASWSAVRVTTDKPASAARELSASPRNPKVARP
jgi:hypothetical protein